MNINNLLPETLSPELLQPIDVIWKTFKGMGGESSKDAIDYFVKNMDNLRNNASKEDRNNIDIFLRHFNKELQ